MNSLDKQYLDLAKKIMQKGSVKKDRTGTGTISISGAMIQHDMEEGFPILTTKKVSLKNVATELEFFLRGYTNKQWLKDRNCFIWNSWCRPSLIPLGLTEEERKEFQKNENDLGPLGYSHGWRNFGGTYEGLYMESKKDGIDQITNLIEGIKKDPCSRRHIVSAWDIKNIPDMSLPPCHKDFQVIIRGQYLDLVWTQRSSDVGAGLPYNISSYGLLLSLLAKQLGYLPGILTGFLGDAHVYLNHVNQLTLQMDRFPFPSAKLLIDKNFKDIRDFDSSSHVSLEGYKSHPSIKLEIAV